MFSSKFGKFGGIISLNIFFCPFSALGLPVCMYYIVSGVPEVSETVKLYDDDDDPNTG